jgi:hypothetical protein
MILVRFLDLKFLLGLAARLAGTSNPPHQNPGSHEMRVLLSTGGPRAAELVLAAGTAGVGR